MKKILFAVKQGAVRVVCFEHPDGTIETRDFIGTDEQGSTIHANQADALRYAEDMRREYNTEFPKNNIWDVQSQEY